MKASGQPEVIALSSTEPPFATQLLNQISVQTVKTVEDQLSSGRNIDLGINSSKSNRNILTPKTPINTEFQHTKTYGTINITAGIAMKLSNQADGEYIMKPIPATIKVMFHYAREDLGPIVLDSDQLMHSETWASALATFI